MPAVVAANMPALLITLMLCVQQLRQHGWVSVVVLKVPTGKLCLEQAPPSGLVCCPIALTYCHFMIRDCRFPSFQPGTGAGFHCPRCFNGKAPAETGRPVGRVVQQRKGSVFQQDVSGIRRIFPSLNSSKLKASGVQH